MPKVSVVIPTRNRVDMLKDAIFSVISQTYKDFEIVISDNNSQDGTEKFVQSLLNKNEKIRYIKSSKSLNMVENWNQGIKFAKGRYIALLMDDDKWVNTFLERTVPILDQKKNVGVVSVQPVPWYFDNSPKSYPKNHYRLFNEDKELPGIACIKLFMNLEWRVGLPSAVITRKSCLNEFGLFNEPGIDLEMWLKILSKYDFQYVDEPLTQWRIHGLGSFTSENANKQIENIYILLYVMSNISGYLGEKDVKNLYPDMLKTKRNLTTKAYNIYKSMSLKGKLFNISNFYKVLTYDFK